MSCPLHLLLAGAPVHLLDADLDVSALDVLQQGLDVLGLLLVGIAVGVHAGQQEQHLRGGTSNAPAYTMWAKTIRLALDHQREHFAYVKTLHEMLYEVIFKYGGLCHQLNRKRIQFIS